MEQKIEESRCEMRGDAEMMAVVIHSDPQRMGCSEEAP